MKKWTTIRPNNWMPDVTPKGPGLLKFNERYVNIITDVGLSASIIFLAVHLIAFFIVDELRNLPARNLASFCAALLLEYSSTLLSTVLEGKACLVNEIAAYYFIMASAFWMLIMSYDVWLTIGRSYAPIREISPSRMTGRRCSFDKGRKFLLYSTCGWLTPALLTFSVFFALPRMIADFRLDFDEKRCYFVETDTMYVFVETVFGTILLLNTSFFASSIYRIYSTQSAVRRSKRNNYHYNSNTSSTGATGTASSSSESQALSAFFVSHFRLYGRLSLIMGITWAAEFVIYFSDFDILSLTFRIINTFEGLLIMLAFTCRKEVFDSVKSLISAMSPPRTNSNLLPFYCYVSLRRLL